MRLLSFALATGDLRARHRYLRRHLQGCDVDPFALEVARLSLTLADIPNPNGWNLQRKDVLLWAGTRRAAQRARILLANPPFEDFTPREKAYYKRRRIRLGHNSKAAEMMARTLPHLARGAVFGIVVPRGLLHSNDAAQLRRDLLDTCEIREVGVLPDRVFQEGAAESAILLGRKTRSSTGAAGTVRYFRVRERDLRRFKELYAVTKEECISQMRFSEAEEASLLLPDLHHVWEYCSELPKLASVASTGQGLQYKGRDLPRGARTYSNDAFQGAVRGFVHFNDEELLLHQLPKAVWMNLDEVVVRRPGTGTCTEVPQILLNYASSSRGPWRLKALIDREGHAVTSRFVTVRPLDECLGLEALWALCNSPVANAYLYSHAGKRDNKVGILRRMPVPFGLGGSSPKLTKMVSEYFVEVRKPRRNRGSLPFAKEAGGAMDETRAGEVLRRLDAEILRLYDMPPRMEREVLDLFAGRQRRGVPFRFDRYYPEGYAPCFPLHEYLCAEFQSSTADKLSGLHERVDSKELIVALDRAARDFGEDRG